VLQALEQMFSACSMSEPRAHALGLVSNLIVNDKLDSAWHQPKVRRAAEHVAAPMLAAGLLKRAIAALEGSTLQPDDKPGFDTEEWAAMDVLDDIRPLLSGFQVCTRIHRSGTRSHR
jgi:hypothetical protein